jgi:phospholipid/cholesterol/gamma-HCH transport system substrate-binding protein
VDHRIPKVGVVISVVLAIGALITFLFLNNKFQGPNPVGFLGNPYELTARFKDNKTLPTKQAVLYKGVSVGTVTGVRWDKAHLESIVKFKLDKAFRLHRDAVIRIGYRSLLGDPYLAVDNRGSSNEPELKTGDEVQHTETTVDFDEALSFLDAEGRRHVKSLIRNVAEGTAAPGNGERLNGTLGGLSRTVSELYTLTSTVKGQEGQISDLVRSASTVLTTIGEREQSIRTIIGAGRRTLDGLAANTSSLEQGVGELPGILDSGRTALVELRPLLTEATPVFSKLSAVAPPLAAALSPNAPHPLKSSIGNLVAIIRGLAPLNKVARPVLTRLKVLLDELVPVVKGAAPGARNLVPALAYLTPRAKAIATGYAVLAAALTHTDSAGHYALLGFNIDPGESLDTPVNASRNAYPGPDDALNPQPFTGSYPHIVPCTVPPRSTPREPCK